MKPLSHTLPELIHRRGGGPLAALLDALDADWLAATPDPVPVREVRARRSGYGFLFDLVGGMDGVTHPQRLDATPPAAEPGEVAAFWLDCLFGAELLAWGVTRPADPSLPVRATARVRTAADPPTVHRVLRLLWPAHWAFDPTDLTCQPGGDPCP